MTNKRKFRKNRKLKSKMKGGRYDGPEVEAAGPSDKSLEAAPVAKPIPIAKPIPAAKVVGVRSKSGGVSDYGSLNMDYFILFIAAIGGMGIIWLFLSRSMIRHEYSEALSYSIVALAIFLSFFIVMFAGLKSMSVGGNTLMDGFKYAFKVVLFSITSCLPAILIVIQLVFLIYLCYTHSDFLYTSDDIPAIFSTFNKLAAVMILGQSYVWYRQVEKIVYGENKDSNPALVPGFILAAIIGGIAISQMYVILEYLKTDC